MTSQPTAASAVHESKTLKNSAESDRSSVHHITSLLVGLVCIGIGVPVWWKTTEIHRAPLSYSEIEALPSRSVISLVEMEVVVMATPEVASLSSMARLGQRLKEKMEAPSEGNSPTLTISYRGQVSIH